MKAAVFVTIWAALALFVAGEAGKRRLRASGREPRWAWPSWMAGAVLCALHIVLALGVVHLWSHEAAIRTTAEQTAAVYGLSFGGGIYVSYAFTVVWLADALWWRAGAARYFRRGRATTIALRAFYLLIIVNGAIVFASPPRQLAGVLVTLSLLWVWRPHRAGQPAVSAPART